MSAARVTLLNADRHQTAYLWERVLTKDSLLEILHKYMHLQVETREDKNGRKVKRETMIFPRYHQLDVVTKLLADVKANGAGEKLSDPAQRWFRQIQLHCLASPSPVRTAQ